MIRLSEQELQVMKADLDGREELIRGAAYEALSGMDALDLTEHIVATYFVVAENLTPEEVGVEICYHMTSGVRKPKKGTLLDACNGTVIDAVSFDREQRCGMVRVAFPLKMLRDAAGAVYSTDLLHIAAGAGVLELRENRDAKLVDLAMSDEVLRTFPGPAYGSRGLRELTGFGDRIAFGTILKPCTGITPDEEAAIIEQAAANPMFIFIKEDENFMPGVPFAPVRERATKALEAIERARDRRGDVGVVFACHVTAPPHLMKDYVSQVLEAGLNGVMFSEYYCQGATRMIREMTRGMEFPPAIYGHNGGITAKTRHIYREVLDMLARLDGIDMRQTAPLVEGRGLLRPFGLEWRKCEEVLTRPLAGKPPVMIARAGGLDQGNIIPNLLDVSQRGSVNDYLFLAGSAINGIKNSRGEYDPSIGAAAMAQALELFEKKVFADPAAFSVKSLKEYAHGHGLTALSAALSQRYGSP
jgi:ribulose-bisphosphate carboxylase large chain